MVDDPALRMAEAADEGTSKRFLDTLGQLRRRHSLSSVHARLDPLELRQDIVGQIKPAVRQDVAFGAAQNAKRRQPIVCGFDLLSLTPEIVRRQALNGADRGSVIADGEVLVAALPRGTSHLFDTCPAVGPSRVRMK